MGLSKNHPLCVQFIAAFSKHVAALDWLWDRVSTKWGPVWVVSEPFEFRESEYYRSSMGDGLKKQFAILSHWYDPALLASHKLESNEWELEFAQMQLCEEERPLNIDPGYMTMTKIVLASTKNREHRIYLRDGIYAEVTLAYRGQQWQGMPWTYPDYLRDDFRTFFRAARTPFAARVATESAMPNAVLKPSTESDQG